MYSFRPEPDPAEREALELALDELIAAALEPSEHQGEWRSTALDEGVSAGEEDDPLR